MPIGKRTEQAMATKNEPPNCTANTIWGFFLVYGEVIRLG